MKQNKSIFILKSAGSIIDLIENAARLHGSTFPKFMIGAILNQFRKNNSDQSILPVNPSLDIKQRMLFLDPKVKEEIDTYARAETISSTYWVIRAVLEYILTLQISQVEKKSIRELIHNLSDHHKHRTKF